MQHLTNLSIRQHSPNLRWRLLKKGSVLYHLQTTVDIFSILLNLIHK